MNTLRLQKVHYLPAQLEPNVLYVSMEFMVAGHLCPCGCGNKIMTPLGATEWTFTENNGEATLFPSLGNWQLPCRSHYWIRKGKIEWSYRWSEKQIKKGWNAEEQMRAEYFTERQHKREKLTRFVRRLMNRFSAKTVGR